MARKIRVQYEGAVYHVMSRGDHREVIFNGDPDREMFIGILGQCCRRTEKGADHSLHLIAGAWEARGRCHASCEWSIRERFTTS